ncbi:hypothetical protein ACLOJK_033584 [Asimina triloba]
MSDPQIKQSPPSFSTCQLQILSPYGDPECVGNHGGDLDALNCMLILEAAASFSYKRNNCEHGIERSARRRRENTEEAKSSVRKI